MSQPSIAKPGVLIKVLGEGVLLQGVSGVGKSDLALALLDRGHCLVADDLVEFYLTPHGRLAGRCPAGFAGFMNLHGLGVVNVTRLYGDRALAIHSEIGLVLDLVRDAAGEAVGRFEGSTHPWSLLECEVPLWRLPVGSGRPLALLVETVVRLNALRCRGYDAAADLELTLAGLLNGEKP